jgi:IS605 OrfB family transposase
MGTIPFNGLGRALSHKIIAEKIQRRYSRRWGNVKGIREAIRKHGCRARNILIDLRHYISRSIVEVAGEYNALIVLEDLDKLRSRSNGSKEIQQEAKFMDLSQNTRLYSL